MGSDFYFRMGSAHAVCQDYALSGNQDGRDFAIISDGCSGVTIPKMPGSPFTDFGARFLALSALQQLPVIFESSFPSEAIIHDVAAKVRASALPRSAVDGTLLVAVRQEGLIRVRQTGDGVVARKLRDGSLQYTSVAFGNNTPYYLSYMLNEQAREKMLTEKEDSGKVTVTTGTLTPGNGWSHQIVEERIPYKLGDHSAICRQYEFSEEDTSVVLILSDGAESFSLKDGTVVPVEAVLEQVFDVPGYVGEFLRRSCNFFQKFCVQNGWSHSDDFSVAGLTYLDK